MNFLKRLIKKMFNQIGLDIIRISKSPKYSLLGLKKLPIGTIIDVGAHKGQFAKYISTLFPEVDIYCFEPLPEPFKVLNDWVEKQHQNQMKGRKVKAFNLALVDREGILEMFSHIEHKSSSSFLKTTKLCENIYPFTKKQISIPVKLTTLDKWIKRLSNPPTREILIKLDVQGYKDRVIKGGKETFSIAKTCILEIGLDYLYEGQATFRDISLLLYNLGYNYVGNLSQKYADDGHVIYIDAVFVKNH